MTCTRWPPYPEGIWIENFKTHICHPKTKTNRTNKITNSRAGVGINHKDQAAAIETTSEAETTEIGTASTAFIAKSRITLLKSAGKE
jgi:hypothetical protein